MAEETYPMEIDIADKGKSVIPAGNPSYGGKASLWVEKYRPQSLDDVAAHRDIVDTIDRLTTENRLPHLLLYGPPGTGKTSTILAVARKLYGAQYHNMILELNASDDRGIDVVRQQIQDFASTQSLSFGLSIVFNFVLNKEEISIVLHLSLPSLFRFTELLGFSSN
ncbi:replication factor C subunit 3-like [Trifolium medium]|uniref:Replication factor C subunit 3-like n=1 Tax=Trifolium medium TaxID=97028 RepID=A0A392PMC6_9FABA|nr:replication factor C subunit 3-like [Trifolium medium]